jgi:hypothetical protein
LDNATLMFFFVSYVGITLLLGLLPADDALTWLDPRSWLLIPIAGAIVAAPAMLLLFALLMIPVKLGLMAEDAVLPGSLWIWTAMMIWFRIGSYLNERRKRLAAPSPAVGKLQRYQKDAFGLSGWRTRKDAGPAADVSSDWPTPSTHVPDAACPTPADAAPHAASEYGGHGCDAPTSSATSSWSGGWDSGSDGGGDSGSSD